jgi:glycosyltransferase involved in cell wall biosynthesis
MQPAAMPKVQVTVEVLLCTYNGAPYIAEQMDSILRQSRPVQAISIFDDGSTDATLAIAGSQIERAAAAGTVITVHRNEGNLGWIENFAQAIRQSTGDILFLCDQDDIWHADKVAALLEALAADDTDLAFSDGELVDAAGQPLGALTVLQALDLDIERVARHPTALFEHLQKANFIGGASLAIKAVAAKASLPPPPAMPIDYWLGLRASALNRARLVNRRLYRYRQHGKNAIGAQRISTKEALIRKWRQPYSDRDRERLIWAGATPRLAATAGPAVAAFAIAKLSFLLRSGVEETQPWGRIKHLTAILWRVAAGDYRRYAPPLAAWADFVATIRSRSKRV